MASLATATTIIRPVNAKGLGGSSLNGAKLAVKPARRSVSRPNLRQGAVVAKYGDKSVYFDLNDIPNTTGQWDLYGSDAASPYNPLQDCATYESGLASKRCTTAIVRSRKGQLAFFGSDVSGSKFFETFAAPFTKRGLLLKFLVLGGGLTISYLSSTASGDLLPIKKGPQKPAELGPRDKI